ncbi:MAG: bacterio-opsin activator domain-containing protein [Haloferacaceae archaeon]
MGNRSTLDAADVLAVFDAQERAGTPLTAPEVADALGCARRTAHKKLTRLAEEGQLATKKVGARGRVWWRPPTQRPESAAAASGTAGRSSDGHGAGPALRELHDASRQLMRAETTERVCEVAVDAARRILGLSLNGLWQHVPERDALEPVAWTEQGVDEYGEPPPFPVEGSLVGEAFGAGTYRAYDDVTTESELYDPDTSVRSELILPLGEYGVLNASSPEVGAFDDVDVSLGRVLAANVETALERADRLEERRARRLELARQRDELATLNRINALVEDTIGALVGAATREEIEGTVCERLAASEFYVAAWIVERDSATGDVVLRTGAGGDGDAGGLPVDPDATIPGPNPADAAIEEGTLQVVSRVADDERVPDRLRRAALASGSRACVVAPLAYADTVFGGLVVHAPEPDAFSDRELTAFETLGRVVGFVINATNNRRLLLGNTAVELEVALGRTDAWFRAAADRLGGTVAVDGLVPTDDALIEYVTVTGVDDAVPARLAELPSVADVRVLAAEDDRWVLECTVDGADGGLAAVVEYGATVRTARAADGAATVTARFPTATAPREAMTVVEEAFPTADLTAKRVVDVSDRSAATIRRRIADRLTDKQRAALRAAYLAGHFETPRDTTARELAASLDIAPSTLHQHLQAAHRKLLGVVFDEPSTG